MRMRTVVLTTVTTETVRLYECKYLQRHDLTVSVVTVVSTTVHFHISSAAAVVVATELYENCMHDATATATVTGSQGRTPVTF